MTATQFTHVSVSARDFSESVPFYEGFLGLEPIPAPNFDIPVRWFRVGDRQIHLFERDIDAPQYHHFALHVEDFEAAYREALENDYFEEYFEEGVPAVYELPDGVVQTYVRDPAGNRIELNWPDIETLPDDVADGIVKRSEQYHQDEEAMRAKLYIDER